MMLTYMPANCLGATILGAIAGAINPLAGKVFGFASVLCQSELGSV